MTRFPYKIGDRVRVTVDNPYETDLHKGDVVTVTETAFKQESSAAKLIPVIFVSTRYGDLILGIDVVEPAGPEEPDYVPAENDTDVDAMLRSMIEADPELKTFLSDADTALAAEDTALSGQLATAEGKGDYRTRPLGPQDVAHIYDGEGSEMEICYVEQDCPNHGRREHGFVFTIDDSDPMMVPEEYMRQLVAWMLDRLRHASRPQD